MATSPAIFQLGDADTHSARPKVFIVGVGLGGLALGKILQKTDTPYEIFERAPEIKPLGSITSLTGVTAPSFKQLGILDEFHALSKLLTTLQVITAPELKTKFDVSDVNDPVKRNMVDSGWVATITRFLMKHMPMWTNGMVERRILSNRPQLCFLPRDETLTEMPPAKQSSLHLKRPERKKAVAE